MEKFIVYDLLKPAIKREWVNDTLAKSGAIFHHAETQHILTATQMTQGVNIHILDKKNNRVVRDDVSHSLGNAELMMDLVCSVNTVNP